MWVWGIGWEYLGVDRSEKVGGASGDDGVDDFVAVVQEENIVQSV